MNQEGASEDKRPRFEPITLGGAFRTGLRWLYPLAAAAFAGAAVYMHQVEGHRLASMYVAGPAIGAAWFAARALMMLGK